VTATDPALAAAWDELHAALPKGWQVGRPHLHDERRTWEQYAWLPTGAPRGGKPKKEWIAVGATEAGCVAEMARCLVELGQGRWPR
jgi:hypothetical protein